MRVGVLLFVGLGLLVITGACGGPGATDDACTSTGNVCVNLSAKPTPACPEALPQYPCSASGAGFQCCSVTGSGGSKGSGGSAGSGGTKGAADSGSKG